MTGPGRIKVLLIDDHPLVIEGLRALLDSFERIELVGTAGLASQGLECAVRTRPDVILMDINMPQLGGIDAIGLFRRRVPDARILILSMHDSREYISAAVLQGAAGYVLKDVPTEEIVAAIETVAGGGRYFSAGVSAALLASGEGGGDGLSPREREVLALLAAGASNRDIAAALALSVATVETHRKNIKKKLGIATTAGLIRFAIQCGLVEEPPDIPTSG